MKLEYRFQDESAHNKEIEHLVNELSRYNLSKISILYQYTKIFSKKIKSDQKLSSIIDFPYGASDNTMRSQMIQNAIKNGANSVEIVLPFHLLSNAMYTSLKKDIEQTFEICEKNKVDLSYILEYRVFNYSVLYRACKLLCRQKINNIYISTGYKVDNLYDHLIAIAMIKKNVPDINITCNANIFTEKHLDILNAADITALSLNSIPSLETATKFISNL